MVRVTPEHVDARKRAILEAACAVFARKGSAAATMQEIARAAGLSAGAIYLYYPSKADLVRAVCDAKTAGVQSIFAAAALATDDPLLVLDQVGRTLASQFDAEDFRSDAILSLETTLAAARDLDDLGAEIRDTSCGITATIAALARQAQERHELDPAFDPETLAVVLQSFAIGLQQLHLQSQGSLDPRAAYAMVMSMLRRLTPTKPDDPVTSSFPRS